MNELKTASAFGLLKYFEAGQDVRRQIRELFFHTKDVVAREREINLQVVLLIGALERQNAAVNLCMWGGKKQLAEALGLTENQYLKRAQAGRVLWRFPEFVDLVRAGKTHVSHIGTLAPKITEANKDIFLNEVVGKTEREVRALVASVNRDGSRNRGDEVTIDLMLTFTKSQIALLERAKEVLSACGAVPSDEDVLSRALEDLLEKRDPVRKAERAAKRGQKFAVILRHAQDDRGGAYTDGCDTDLVVETITECEAEHSAPNDLPNHHSVPNERRSISAAVKHAATLRDQGRCSFQLKDGNRCKSRVGIQFDHIRPVALGGGNELDNIRILCREHNLMEAVRILDAKTMDRFAP